MDLPVGHPSHRAKPTANSSVISRNAEDIMKTQTENEMEHEMENGVI